MEHGASNKPVRLPSQNWKAPTRTVILLPWRKRGDYNKYIRLVNHFLQEGSSYEIHRWYLRNCTLDG